MKVIYNGSFIFKEEEEIYLKNDVKRSSDKDVGHHWLKVYINEK